LFLALAVGASSKKVLMVLTSQDALGAGGNQTGWYLPEAAHPAAVFAEAGVGMAWASPGGGEAPVDEGSAEAYKDDEVCKAFLASDDWRNTEKLSEVKPDDFDAVFVVGGYGVMWDLVGNADLESIVSGIWEDHGIVSGVCHGPAALVGVKLKDGTSLVKGKEVACFTNAEEDALGRRDIVPKTCEDAYGEAGAKFTSGKPWTDHIAEAGRLITGQNPMSAKSTAEAVVKALESEEEPEEKWQAVGALRVLPGTSSALLPSLASAALLGFLLVAARLARTPPREVACADEELLAEEAGQAFQ